MRIHREENLKDFEFWSGALQVANRLTEREFDIIERELKELYPEGLSETEVNDIFWFDIDTLAYWIDTIDEEILGREVR